jgi:hypothetical protein
MKTILTEQQVAHFAKNGSIEFEFDAQELFPLLKEGRDLWAQEETLKTFLIKKLGRIALALTGKKQMRLGCDEYILAKHLPKKNTSLKDLFSLQGALIGLSICKNPVQPAKRSLLGILPFPSAKDRILFFKPHLLLDWPHTPNDLYLVLFVETNGIYRENPNDPKTNYLKSRGYHFGDKLKNETHPLIV